MHFLLIHLFLPVLHSKPCYRQKRMHHVAQQPICCQPHADTGSHALISSAVAHISASDPWSEAQCAALKPQTHTAQRTENTHPGKE